MEEDSELREKHGRVLQGLEPYRGGGVGRERTKLGTSGVGAAGSGDAGLLGQSVAIKIPLTVETDII